MAARKRRSQSESSAPPPAAGPPRPWCLPVGLWGLAFWLLGGLALETLHGFKATLYLEDPVRRELWTLAHAHGTLMSAVCLLLALLAPRLALAPARARRADRLFAGAAVLLPAGFLLGGIGHSESDPSLAILLVPAGALAAAAALVLLASGLSRRARSPAD